jgi:cytochrome c oxidase assembly protein subunit 15
VINQRFLSRLAFCASFFALCVIALGALTRLMDAGLGCPDWPGCYGQMTVPVTQKAQQLAAVLYPGTHIVIQKAWAEMIHRYFVAGLSVFIVTIVAFVFCKKQLRRRVNILLCLALIALLVYQILLGQWTVTLKLWPVIVTQHLLGGYLILSTLWLMYLYNKKNPNVTSKSILLPGAIIALLLLILQIMLGAWTSTNYASLSCRDFPFCMNDQSITFHFKQAFNFFRNPDINYEGGVLPTVIRQTIQMSHRFGALILTIYLFAFVAYANVKLKQRFDVMKILYLILGLLCVQLSLGISNVLFQLPLLIALSHTIVAVLLLLSLLTLIVKLKVTA